MREPEKQSETLVHTIEDGPADPAEDRYDPALVDRSNLIDEDERLRSQAS